MHNKQFIITKRTLNNDEFNIIRLDDGYNLFFHKELNVIMQNDSILIGHAFQCDSSKRNPEDELEDMISPIDTYNTWNGRWVLIYKNEIHPDACSQIGVFYGAIKNELIISSSLALIAELYDGEFIINEHMPLEYDIVLSWVPGPYTVIDGINRLLPTQYLIVNDGFEVCFRNPISKNDYSHLSVDDIYIKLFELQKCMFNNIEKYDFSKFSYSDNIRNIFNIGLTAGYDSRMQAALMKKMGLVFKSHTFDRRKSTENADKKYPQRIAQVLGIEWKAIPIGKREAKRVIEFNKHTFNSVKDRDWKWHYTCGQYDYVDGNVIVSSSIWEAFSNYYVSFGSTANIRDSKEEKYSDLKRIFPTLEGNPIAEKSFRKYIEWVDDNPINGMSWADRITFEQLMGIWDGNENQGKDLFSDKRFLFNPANSMEIFALICALPKEKRVGRLWEIEVANMFAPELAGIPYNDKTLEAFKNFYYPYGDVLKGKNVILYGAGNVGISFYLQIVTHNKCNIILWVDKNYKRINEFGIKVESPDVIKDMNYDYIIICIESKKIAQTICDELVVKGIDKNCILWKETRSE